MDLEQRQRGNLDGWLAGWQSLRQWVSRSARPGICICFLWLLTIIWFFCSLHDGTGFSFYFVFGCHLRSVAKATSPELLLLLLLLLATATEADALHKNKSPNRIEEACWSYKAAGDGFWEWKWKWCLSPGCRVQSPGDLRAIQQFYDFTIFILLAHIYFHIYTYIFTFWCLSVFVSRISTLLFGMLHSKIYFWES